MLWFILGIVIVILVAYIAIGALQLVFGIIGAIIRLILRPFGFDDD